MRSLRSALLVAALGGALVVAAPVGPAAADSNGPSCPIQVQDGMTQPVYSFADAIEQRVWVETPLDTDHDGKLDRVVADISRPRETDTEGCKVPVIFEQSPYRKGVWFDVPYPSVLVDQLPQISLMHPHDTRAGVSGVGLLGNLPGTLDDYDAG